MKHRYLSKVLFFLLLFFNAAEISINVARSYSPEFDDVLPLEDPQPEVRIDLTGKVRSLEAPCPGISPLDCSQILQGLPVNFDFTQNQGGLSESGFTMVLEPSAPLTTPTNSDVPGYEPGQISRDVSGLSIISTKGIFYSQPSGTPSSNNTNSQVNALGVELAVPTGTFSVSSTLINPNFQVSNGNSSQQAGIWFGKDEDHYVKLVVVKNGDPNQRKIQLQVENMDNTTSQTAFLEINTANLSTDTGPITLRLEFDPVANTVQGFYRLGAGEEVLVTGPEGDSRSVPASYFSGQTYSGIFTSHRNAAAGEPITGLFTDFSIEEAPVADPGLVAIPYRMNVAGFDYSKDGDLFLEENMDYLVETEETTASFTSYSPYEVSGGHQDLYYPRRFGANFGYDFPIANGQYTVRVHMVENYQTTAGARIFDILMEGELAQDNLDLFELYGKGVLGITQNNVTVSDGELNLQFIASANNALIQAIEILPLTASAEKDILGFSVNDQISAETDFEAGTIEVVMPPGTDLSSLAPDFTLSNNAVVTPTSGSTQNFTSPVTYTVTAEDGSTQDWTVTITALPSDFSFIENFDNYGTGNLHEIAPTQWLKENAGDASIPVVNEGLSDNTSHYLDFSLGNHAHDLIPLTNNPVTLTPNVPFYFATYFQVNSLGTGAGDRIRTAIRIDENSGATPWVRLQMAKGGGTGLIARVGLAGPASDNGTEEVPFGETVQFLVKGVWDGASSIAYQWTLAPTVSEAANTWTNAGNQTVSGTPQIGRLFISSASTNNAKVGPVRLSTDYSQVVTEDLNAVPLLSGNAISSFSLAEQAEEALIDAENHTVSVLVPFGTDRTALSPTYILSEAASAIPASGESQDFTNPVEYTVTAEDGTVQVWTVSVSEKAEVAKGFQTFSLSGGIGEVNINQVNQEVTILVPFGTDITALTPEFTFDGSEVSPASGLAQDFTNPVIYTFIGSDGSSAEWTVSVTVASGFAANINFQDRTTVPPAGYLIDYGKQFGHASLAFNETDYAYGWKLKSSGAPFDASDEAANNSTGVGRNRIVGSYSSAPVQEQLEGTLVHFQGDNILNATGGVQSWSGQPRGNELFWEMEVPNGIYEVTVGLGDAGTDLDSRHSATVEGYTVVPAFVPEAGENRNGTLIVEVTDGLLTMNGLGGYNSKINYIRLIESSGTPASGQLSFDPALVNSSLAPGATGAFSSTLTGSGAGNIGLVIDDNINSEDKLITGSNDWLSLPQTAALGSIDFSIDASALAEGETRNNTIIATAQGYQPAVLEAGLSIATPLSADKSIETFALQGGIGTISIDAENEAVNIQVPFGTDVTTLTPEFTISGASVTPVSGTSQDFTNPVVYTVLAADGSESDWTVTVLVETPDPCSPWSLLDCNGIPKALPLRLEFDGTDGGLEDGSGVGTGFTMVDPHSESRLAADLPVTYPEVIGYEPSKIAVNGGNLRLTASKGIAYLNPGQSGNTNTQVNSLGVGIADLSQPLVIETQLLGIATGGNSAQSGIWFGLDEDNFVKLNVNANNVELRKELNALSVNGTDSPDQIQVTDVGVNGQNVTLRMVVDPQAMTITGYYAIGSGDFVELSKTGLESMSLPQDYLNGLTVGDETGLAFAGIYSSYRNGSTAFDTDFAYFSVDQETPPLSLDFSVSQLNFSGEEGATIAAQSVELTSSTGNPTIVISDDPDSGEWLTLPTNPALGTLEFSVKEDLEPGTYSTMVMAIDQPDLGYSNAEMEVSLVITEANVDPGTPDFEANINFSDPETAAPSGYLRDAGDAYGDRGNGFSYGWLDAAGNTLADLTLNGRNREVAGVSVLENTLSHMQYGDVSDNAANGYLPDAKWELAVPNGSYSVTVGVGDPNVDGSVEDTPSHTINVEGISAINAFVPQGETGAPGRFTTGTVQVVVADGRLTLDPGTGFNTKINFVRITATEGGVQTPRILGVNPENGAINVSVTTSVSANNLFLPNPNESGLTSVDNSTITNSTVRLFKQSSNTPIGASVNGTGGGDAINLVPSLPLEANTTYVFEVDGVKDLAGEAFEPFTSSFTTGSGGSSGPTTDLDNVSFTKQGAVASGAEYTTLTIGPENKLYGLTIGGDIHRWTINADGTLSGKQTLSAWKSAYNGRTAVGLEFDPNATAGNLIAYVSHNSAGLNSAPDWDGKLSRLTGANLENEELLVTNLPRSLRDHLTNSIAFRPGEPNMLYFNQGSNSAGGAPDGAWGNREESLLSAATLKLDLTKLPATLPLDAMTTRNQSAINNVDINSPTLDGMYNPYYVNAPLTLFATGVRNAYDLVWHSNGQMYVPANGTAGGSNSPASVSGTRRPDGTIYDHSDADYPPISASNNNNVQRDWLFRMNPSAGLGYYGHPNPFRGEFVLNRGDADVDNSVYNGVQPDVNYRGAAFDFEFNKSPNGVIEYRSNAENGNLTGALLVVRYSGGSDIIALVPDGPNGDISTFKEGIPGFTGFGDPLDLIEDVSTGNIYVSDYARSEIVLLKPSNQAAPAPSIAVGTEEVVGDAVVGGSIFEEEILLSNLGNAPLEGITTTITGTHSDQFTVTGLPTVVNAQNSASFTVEFTPASTGPKFALLTISGQNADPVQISLSGLGKIGTGGNEEPSLQWILDSQLGQGLIDVGDTDPATNLINLPAGSSYNNLLGDELDIQYFQRATDAPVEIEVLSVYGPEGNNPITGFGWYSSGDGGSTQELFTVQNNISGNGQTLNPVITGSTSFDPGTGSFGFYNRWPFFSNRFLYSEDALNSFTGAIPHHIRVYALPGEANAYIIATEEHVSGFDYQDIVVIARNVRPFDGGSDGCSPISLLDCSELEAGLPFSLQFTGDEGGLGNTGFTMVDNPSARLDIDGAVSYPNVPGYEPGRLSLSGGNLLVNAANGIAYRTNGSTNTTSTDVNSQINTLGVGIDANGNGNFSISTTVLNPYSDGSDNSEQAGIWFGLNEDNFVKLVVANGGKVEILREINGLAPADVANNIQANGVSAIHSSAVTLRLYVDVENNLLTGYYSLNGGVEIELGSVALPATYLNGNPAHQDLTFAGVFASKRRETVSEVVYTFTEFEITPDQLPAGDFDPIKINFSRAIDDVPAGYIKDSGAPYGDRGNGYDYGWLTTNGQTPLNLADNTRNRDLAGVNLIQNTLIHMQYGDAGGTNGVTTEGIWELDVPNGTYEVTIGVGDPEVDGQEGTTPSHTINVEGVNAVDGFVPTGIDGASSRMTSVSVTATILDGRLTIDASGGFNTKVHSLEIVQKTDSNVPLFINVTPANNATNVSLNDLQVNVEILTPDGYELDNGTLAGNINLYELTVDGEVFVPSNSNDTGGGDAITLTPIEQLKENTTYLFRISGVEANRTGDLSDRLTFATFESRFTTGTEDDLPVPVRDLEGVAFTAVPGGTDLGEGTVNERFSSLVIGPDGKLYASTVGDFQSDGKIFRWDIEADGTLINLEVLSPELNGSPHPETGMMAGNNRLIIGLVFDPASTADNLIAYVTHSAASLTNGPAWDGKLTKLTGPDLNTVQDLVIHLPRSTKDHLTNSLAFDEEGLMYIAQGSNSAGGAPDPAWGNRAERLLAAAVLRVDLDKLPANLPLSVYTTDDIGVINAAPSNGLLMGDGSTYNPYSADSPVTIFATGIRNAYDLIWHSNGWLYVPTNGTAGNNSDSPNSPSTNNYSLARRIDGLSNIPFAPALTGGETQKDWLFKTQGGSYHGHPNPYRGEFILNHGGMPYSGVPGQETEPYRDVAKYPTTLGPDPNYRTPAYDFGKNKSPNGVIEYKSDAFEGRLQGLLMVVRFSGQDDIFVMEPNNNGNIGEVYNQIPGLGGFDDPLDLVEDPNTGNIYVSEYDRDNNGIARLTLLRAAIPATLKPELVAAPEELLFETTNNTAGDQSQTKVVEITNEGNEGVTITGVSVAGPFADQYDPVSPVGTATLAPGESITYSVTYAPDLNTSNLGYQEAVLEIATDNPEQPVLEVGLHGLKKTGFEGGNEPPLQDVVDALGIGINVGWTSLSDGTQPVLKGDEVLVQQWVKAGAEDVKITPIGRYSPDEEIPFGWYTEDESITLNEVGVMSGEFGQHQTLYPEISEGTDTFDPQGAVFGVYVTSQVFNRTNYTEDDLNTEVARRVRTYPVKDREGNLVENSYLINFEDASNGDYQDYMFVIENVIPFEDGTLRLEFDPEVLALNGTVNDSDPVVQEVTLSANGGLTAGEVSLSSSDPRLNLPATFELGTPFEISFDKAGLAIGNYTATLTADAPNYEAATLEVRVNITQEAVYVYQFNFQTPEQISQSPEGYVDDLGAPYGLQTTDLGQLNFGWVLPGTETPADASVNGRNRNTVADEDPLLNTFTIIGHRTTATYPQRDWLVELPNGLYNVNISVGDPDYTDSYHSLDVNGVRVIDFNQESSNPDNLVHFENTEMVEVTDGKLRLSLAAQGVNAKPNYIRIAPINTAALPPTLSVEFEGLQAAEGVYRGPVSIKLIAADQSESGAIERLEYSINGAAFESFTEPFVLDEAGDFELLVEAEDANGNITSRNYSFSIEEPTNALLGMENMTKVPGTERGFPAEDYFTFYRINNTGSTGAKFHDNNVMRLNNTGTEPLVIDEIIISDENRFIYNIVPQGIESTELPMTIQPGSSRDLSITFIGVNGNNTTMMKETLEIVSNADNGENALATLHGGYVPVPEGGKEIDAQQVFDAFGFKTSMLSIVNDEGTINPPNTITYRPSSNYPIPENIDAGYEGDMILSDNFVQADPTKPVIGIQLSALHGGPSSNGSRFVEVDGTGTVGGMSFSHQADWYQTLLPKAGDNETVNFDVSNSISQAFRISVSSYLSSGGNNINGDRPDLLGLRIYKAIDREGNIIPNEYIVLQDFVQNGCGAGSANCDWNDNTFYFINIRPEAVPTATALEDYMADPGETISMDLSGFFDKGYPGNKLQYSATLVGGAALPGWLTISSEGVLSGTVPGDEANNYNLLVTATDLNGLTADSEMNLSINQAPEVVLEANVTEGRVPLTVAFSSDNSTDEGEIVSYAWDFGDGNSSDEPNPSHTFTSIGTYTVELTLTDDRGLVNSATQQIEVVDLVEPIAVAIADVQQGIAPLTVQFDGSESEANGSIVAYAWDFDDESSSTLVSPAHTFATPGTYTVSLMVTDDNGESAQTTLVIEVDENLPPVAVPDANVTTGNAPLTVSFTGDGSSDDLDDVTYFWDFGNGDTSTEENPAYTFTQPGTYTVVLTVTDGNGNVDEQQLEVVVTDPGVQPSFELRINAGGPEVSFDGKVFDADNYFEGGKTYTNTSATVPALYQTERSSTPKVFGYNVPVPNGTYEVILHFAEIYHGATGGGGSGTAGQRVFDVSIEDVLQLDNYDINALVGPQTPVTEVFEVEVIDGQLNMDFSALSEVGGTDQPKLAAFEILSVNEEPVAPDFTLYLNTGSVADVSLEGKTFIGDINLPDYFDTDHTYTNASASTEPLYQTERGSGADLAPLNLSIEVPNGTYTVSTYHNELYFGKVVAGGAGSRVFDIVMEGQLVKDDLDLFLESGNTPVKLTFTNIEVADGLLEIALNPSANRPSISGIAIEGATTTNEPPVAVAEANVTSGFAPLTVNFTGTNSTDAEGEVTYLWDFGTGVTTTQANPEYTFATAGTYEVSLTVTDESGASNVDAVSIEVAVNQPPVAVAEADITSGLAPLTVNFTGANSTDAEGEVTYLWDFGTGVTTTQANPEYTFATAGTYEVSLTVTDELGASNVDAVSIEVAANQPPVAVAEADITSGLAPLRVNFTGFNSTDAEGEVTYLWDFGTGVTTTQANPEYTFATAGTYEVSLTVTDELGASDVATVSIEVGANQPPVAVAIANVTSGTAPLTVSFTGDNSSDPEGAVSYQWDFGNGFTSIQPNPVFTFNQIGSYNVTLKVTDALGVEDTDELVVTVSPDIVIPVDPSFELRINAGGPALNHDGKFFAADNYFIGGSTYSNTSAPVPALYQTERSSAPKVFNYAVPVPNGTYQVILHFAEIYWGANGGGAGGAGKRVFDVSLEGNVVLDDLDINAEVGTQTVFTESVQVTVTDGELTMNFTSLGGVDQPKLSGFEILGLNEPPVAVATSDNTSGTAPLTVNFTGANSSDAEGGVTYLWNFGTGATSTEANPSYTFVDAGDYEVTLTVTDAQGATDNASIQIAVEEAVMIPVDPSFELRINAGGPALNHNGNAFAEDTYFIGGKSYTNTNATVPALYQTERSSTPKVFDYGVPVPNGTYQVILHFAEIFWGANGGGADGIGKRVFDVSLEGNLVLDDLDLNAEVGTQTVLTQSFEVTVSDGELNMNFTSLEGVNQPKLSAFEILGLNEPPVAVATSDNTSGTAPLTVNFTGANSGDVEGAVTYLWDFGTGAISTEANPSFTFVDAGDYEVTLTVTDAQGATDNASIQIAVEEAVVIPEDPSFELRINAGGPALSHDGKAFAEDNYFIGGKSYTNTNATVPALYQTERSSTPKVFDYAVPVPNGAYQVILHFAEIYWGADGGSTGGSSKRVFDVSVEGDLVLDDLDINAEVGPQTVLTQSFEVTVADGELNMNFTSLSGLNQPKLSAFEIISVSSETVNSEVGLRTNQENAPMLVASPMEGTGPLMVKFSGDLLGTADPELSYYWDFGNGNASKKKNPVSIFTEPGVYEVKARISKYGVPLYTETVQITVFEDVASLENDSSTPDPVLIKMYPNPASTFLKLTLDHETEQIAEVRIFDLRGRLVNTFVPGDGNFSKSYEISVNDLPAGVYFVSTITNSGHRDMQRLIVVR
ncbi:PKD domain-containing protein [Cyclobacterium jeungdonense]|uniref:Malectin domain-containing carbohydrate-binding protein n=1 Tax=Cyclobacterium jeungdonense TaxID=708087 RepID=A0ABT8C7T0_9BACT|nr:malectin domain-containing carbohydrate-binding protein [Cyclobacterium jeungdonense]MDN3688840.1 malectin domain-containing carbohydrate-binding protein [Cyclobacterium jeungdonense]